MPPIPKHRRAKYLTDIKGPDRTRTAIITDTMDKHDEDSLKRMAAIWAIDLKYDRAQAVLKVSQFLECTEAAARNAMREAQNYFADTANINKEVERYKMILRAEALAKDDRVPVEIRIKYDLMLIELLGLKREDVAEKKALIPIVLTGDPSALRENEANE